MEILRPKTNITYQKFEAFASNGESLGYLDYWQHLDLLVKIKSSQARGYYFEFPYSDEPGRKYRIEIDRNGTLEEYPKGFYDLNVEFLMQLL